MDTCFINLTKLIMSNIIKFDIEKLKQISLRDLASHLGIKTKWDKGNCECFWLEHKNQSIRPSLNINDWKWFYCFKSCWVKWATAIDLFMQFNNCDFKEAWTQLSSMYNIQAFNDKEFQKPKPINNNEDLLDLSNHLKSSGDFLNDVSPNAKRVKFLLSDRCIYWESQRLMKMWLINNFYVSMIDRYNKSNWLNHKTHLTVISFPMYDENYKFTWLKVRFLQDDLGVLPKWTIPKSISIKWSKNWLFFMPDELSKSDNVIICEWEIDWASLIELGYKNIIINLWWVWNCMHMIKELCKDKKIIYCVYDVDKAWNEASKKLSKVLNRRIRRVLLPISDWKTSTDINDKVLEWWTKDDFDKAIYDNFVYDWFDKEPDNNSVLSNDKSRTKTDTLLELVLNSKNIRLFYDESKTSYAQIIGKWASEICPCRGRIFETYLSRLFWDTYNTAIRSDDIKNALNVIESKALKDWEQYELCNRIAWVWNNIYYDIADKNNTIIEINKDWWRKTQELLILFKRYTHQKPNIEPVMQWWDVFKVLNYLNFKNKEHELLFLVYLISLFIPKIPHQIIVFYWSKWASKSTSSKIIRKIVDPSILELISLPTSNNELTQILDHNLVIPFDNLSKITQIQSDILCRTVTGEWFSKRALYTDNEDIIYSFKRCIILNWINLSSTKSDLLDRSLLFELDRIDKCNRKSERILWKDFKNDLPAILWWIFDILVKTLTIFPSIKLLESPRMADFAEWWCAIAESIWFSHEEFIKVYDNNIKEQNYEVVQDDIVASTIVAFMKHKQEWQWTPSQLLKEFDHILFTMNKIAPPSFPKTAQSLSRAISWISSNLQDDWMNIEKWKSENWNRFIRIINQKYLKWNSIASNASNTTLPNSKANNSIGVTVDVNNNSRFNYWDKWIWQLTNYEQNKLAQVVFNWM